MESISRANKILQDSTGYQTKMLWNPYQQQTRSYKILRDTRPCYGIHINSKQDPTRFYGILDKNVMESISIANKILQDPKRSCKILHAMDPTRSYKILRDTRQKCYGIHINSKQDPTRFYGILDKNAMESISIANKILQDSTGYQTKMLWNPYQQQTRSYKILRDTRQKCYGIHINSKQDPTRLARSYKILQDSTGYQTKMLWNPYQQQTRSYKILILDNFAKILSRSYKILQDSTGYQTKMLWNPYQQQTRSYKILQDPTRSYKILRDTRQKCYGIHINSKQDPTRFYGILANMLWNPYQQQTRSYKILRDTRQKCYGIHINSKQDPTRS